MSRRFLTATLAGSAFGVVFALGGSTQAVPASKALESMALASKAPASKVPASKAPAEPPTPPPRPAPAPAPPQKVVDTATADDVVITSGTTTYRIKHIALTGTKLSDADLAALLDQKSATSLEARLRSISAASIEIPEIVGDDPTPGSRRHWTVTKVLLANVVAGKAGAGGAHGVTFTVTQGGETVEGTLGAIQGTGLDLPRIAHVVGATRVDEKEPLAPLGDTFAIETIKLANVAKGTQLALATFKATTVEGRPLRTDHAAANDGGAPDRPTLFSDVTHSFAAGSIDAADLAAARKDPSSDTIFGAKQLFLKNFRDGQGTGGLREVHFNQADLAVAVGTIDFDDLAADGALGKSPPVETPAAKTAPVAAASLRGMIAAGQIAVATRPSPSEGAMPLDFKIAHLAVVGDARQAGDLPRDLAVAMDHLTFATGTSTATARALTGMGYERLDLSAALASRYDEAARTLMVDKLSISGAGMGTATLGLRLANAGNGLVSPNAEVAKAAALALVVKGIDLTIVDAGLLDEVIAWKAKNDGIGVADERALGVDYFSHALPDSIGGANAKVLGAAVGAFIAKPKTLHVTASTKDGLGAADFGLLATPDVLLDKLDLRAVANE